MNSFDNYIGYTKGGIIQIDDYPLSCKRSLEINSARNYNSNNLSTSSIQNQSSILFPNKSTTNKKHNNYLYNGNPIECIDISKKNLEYDIQLTALKKKLSVIKEQRKESESKVHLMKLKINKLQNEEKASIRELENIKKRIQKIKNNRKKNEINYLKKSQNTKNYNKTNSFISNKTHSFIKDKYKTNDLSSSNFKGKVKNNNLMQHKSFQISMRKSKNFSNLMQNNCTPKSKLFINKKALNSSNNRSNTSSNENYGTYSFRNTSINLDKLNINNNNVKNNNLLNKINKNSNTNINKNINNKNDLKSQIKQNLVNKLIEDEKERKRIQEEIRQIEKEQYDLWMNFSENMNSGNTTSNTKNNNNYKKNIITDLYYKDEDDDNLVNYNYI